MAKPVNGMCGKASLLDYAAEHGLKLVFKVISKGPPDKREYLVSVGTEYEGTRHVSRTHKDPRLSVAEDNAALELLGIIGAPLPEQKPSGGKGQTGPADTGKVSHEEHARYRRWQDAVRRLCRDRGLPAPTVQIVGHPLKDVKATGRRGTSISYPSTVAKVQSGGTARQSQGPNENKAIANAYRELYATLTKEGEQ